MHALISKLPFQVALDQLASMSELETMANQIIRVNVTNDVSSSTAFKKILCQ